MDAVVGAATSGDRSAFSELFGRHRNELRAHAYRMLGSYEDSEDLTQETFLRAWDKRESFRGDSSFRSWLYRIATNACLNVLELRAHRRRFVPRPTEARVDLEPEGLLDRIATTDSGPDAQVESKETLELALLATIQHLSARQRAVVVLIDVLGWQAKDTADLLETSVASVNSALQRARATLRKRLPESRLEWPRGPRPSAEERALLRRYTEAAERAVL